MSNLVDANHDPAGILNNVLRGALNIPGAKINRAEYLKTELSKRVPSQQVELAITRGVKHAAIPPSIIRDIALSSIQWHRAGVTSASAVAGLPGGWWMAATIPADLTQFFYHVVVILQKLAYLHNWPELFQEGGELDDETLYVLTLFVGVMFGSSEANKVLYRLSEMLATETANRLPKLALTKYGIYNLTKQIAKWLGVKLTKEKFAQGVSKAIPILGAIISGGMTWVSFSQMSNKLLQSLEKRACDYA
ncbi:hypothetical protein [Chitinibacter sp. ZOR0017]|uniref:hypothetical protein n=1 Tax=Chitinibacter sp. ZOR0017 TaxID=1339254 RepID=UPI00068C7C74|nr:hypothetical protein [Chitinibacter sp. ZOR0017]